MVLPAKLKYPYFSPAGPICYLTLPLLASHHGGVLGGQGLVALVGCGHNRGQGTGGDEELALPRTEILIFISFTKVLETSFFKLFLQYLVNFFN